jgi:hypothetical protein
MAKGTAEVVQSEGLSMPPEQVAAFMAILDKVPFAPDGSAEDMFASVLGATSWDDWEGSGSMPALKDLAPVRLKVTSVTKRDSELDGAIPVYLICDAIDVDKGVTVRFNTSAGVPFLKLAMLCAWGNLPALVQVSKALKPTSRGYYPLNLEVLGAEGD